MTSGAAAWLEMSGSDPSPEKPKLLTVEEVRRTRQPGRRGINSEERTTFTRSSRGNEFRRVRGMIASDASSATRAMRIRRAGWRHASIASTTTLKKRLADKAASKVSVSTHSQRSWSSPLRSLTPGER